MKIVLAIPGHLKTVPMGAYCADALRELGHQVTVVDYRSQLLDKLQEKLFSNAAEEKASVNRRVRRVIDAVNPDAFITLFGFDISPQTLAHLRQLGIPSACWWINDPFQFARSLRKAPHYDFLFSNSSQSTADYRAAGISHAYFLPQACQPTIHYKTEVDPAYRCELCFAGDWSPLREELLLTLHDDFDLRIFGPWGKKLNADSPLRSKLREGFFSPQAMTAMFNSADLVLNLHTWFGKFTHGVNPRLFEAAGCAALQLADRMQETPNLFVEHGEIFLYDQLAAVKSVARDILRLPAAEREAIRAAAQHRAYGEHTYQHRLASLLDTMGRAGA